MSVSSLPEPEAEQILEFPDKLLPVLFTPARYKVAHGGRGSAKSWGFARALLALSLEKKIRILCVREFQNSIQESVHQLLRDQISLMELEPYFIIQQTTIKSYKGSDFIFAGIRSNPTKIKSTEGVDIVWCEEAEKISERSWEILIPTIRKPGSEIWVTFNPDEESDPTYKRFVISPPDEANIVEMSFRDNPWFPVELCKEKDYLARVDADAYAHVWEGKCRKASGAQILRGKTCIEYFDPGEGWDGPYQGADWGFAEDPTTFVRCWIHDNKLYVEHEVYKVGLDIDKTPEAFDAIPDARKYTTRADSARPETISYMQRHGYSNMVGVDKWPGSVEEGITIIRSFEQIVFHPRCTHAIQEARLYSYKVDPLTGDVLPKIEDKHNHICCDGLRYALSPFIKRSGPYGMLGFMQAEAEKRKQDQVTG